MKKLPIIICGLLIMPLTLNAQTCKPESIKVSHPNGEFFDNKNGTITDIKNGILWTLCSDGQFYNEDENICQGDPKHFDTWKEALIAGQQFGTFAGFNDWKLPNIKELSSLVERSCVSPAINLTYFPSTPSAVYWSNTFDHLVNYTPGIEGRIVDFKDGTEFLDNVNSHRLIRYVRKLTNK